jgi:putative peptidoglycan lipid II flippase
VTKIAFANVIMVAFLFSFRGEPSLWIEADITLRVVRLSLVVIGGAAVYALCLVAVGIRPRHLRAPSGALE